MDWYANIPVGKAFFLGNQQKSSYFALASNESLLLFIFFPFELYLIKNECSDRRETLFFSFFLSFFFYINNLKLFFDDRPFTPMPHGNVGSTYTHYLRVNVILSIFGKCDRG